MCCDIRVLAPAKVNFALKVGAKDATGYHSIESVFQTVSLCDTLTIRKLSGKDKCLVRCGGKESYDNTVARAYNAFAQAAGMCLPSVSVDIEKTIPMGGGLGGGSSDAAAFVHALEVMSGTALTEEEKCFVASKVGCDVYFFLLCGEGGSAVVTGRGERVKPIRARVDLKMLLVMLPFSCSTPKAYSLLDEWRKAQGIAPSVLLPASCEGEKRAIRCSGNGERLEAVYERPPKEWTFVNDFTPPVSSCFTTIKSILGYLRKRGAAFCEMSGSGSTLYGVFDTDEGVERARLMLAECYGECHAVAVRPFGGSYKMLC